MNPIYNTLNEMIKKSREMFLKGLWCSAKIQTSLPPFTSVGEMWGDGIKAHWMHYCVCNIKLGKSSTKIPRYKPWNRLALSFFKKWEWQNNEYSDFFDNAEFDKVINVHLKIHCLLLKHPFAPIKKLNIKKRKHTTIPYKKKKMKM